MNIVSRLKNQFSNNYTLTFISIICPFLSVNSKALMSKFIENPITNVNARSFVDPSPASITNNVK